MIKIKKTVLEKKIKSYEKFFQEIQKAKMKELWDNKEDEHWDKITT